MSLSTTDAILLRQCGISPPPDLGVPETPRETLDRFGTYERAMLMAEHRDKLLERDAQVEELKHLLEAETRRNHHLLRELGHRRMWFATALLGFGFTWAKCVCG